MRAVWHRQWQWVQRFARPRAPEPLPARLDRKRIYVLPTRFGFFVAGLLVAMLVGALNYNNNPALLLALLLATTAVASTLFAHLQLSGLQLEAASAEPVAAGTTIKLRLTLARQDARPRRGLRVAHAEQAAHANLTAGSREEVDLWLPTQRRGWMDLERLHVSTTQPLGLARAWSWFWPEAPLLVYPTPEAHGPPLPEHDGSPARTRPHPQGDELQQLRGYRPGDPMHSISWKHSARRDTLLVREYERPIGLDIQLDWQRLAPLPYEQRISRLARWVDEAERQGRRYRMNVPGHTPLGPSSGQAHRHQCLRALALMPHA